MLKLENVGMSFGKKQILKDRGDEANDGILMFPQTIVPVFSVPNLSFVIVVRVSLTVSLPPTVCIPNKLKV